MRSSLVAQEQIGERIARIRVLGSGGAAHGLFPKEAADRADSGQRVGRGRRGVLSSVVPGTSGKGRFKHAEAVPILVIERIELVHQVVQVLLALLVERPSC